MEAETIRKSAGAILFASIEEGVRYGREIGVIPSVETGTRISTEDLVGLIGSIAAWKGGEFLRVPALEEAGNGGFLYSFGKTISKLMVKAIAGV